MFSTVVDSETFLGLGPHGALIKAKSDAMPRKAKQTRAEPDFDEIRERRCANCRHGVRILLDGKGYFLCAQERDDHAEGEVYECDPEMRDCDDWRWDADQLD